FSSSSQFGSNTHLVRQQLSHICFNFVFFSFSNFFLLSLTLSLFLSLTLSLSLSLFVMEPFQFLLIYFMLFSMVLTIMLAEEVIYFDRYRARVSHLDIEMLSLSPTPSLWEPPKPPIFHNYFLENDRKLGISTI
ncbi:hypothetical protein Pfo_021877, partial [Paulownia fortunei]